MKYVKMTRLPDGTYEWLISIIFALGYIRPSVQQAIQGAPSEVWVVDVVIGLAMMAAPIGVIVTSLLTSEQHNGGVEPWEWVFLLCCTSWIGSWIGIGIGAYFSGYSSRLPGVELIFAFLGVFMIMIIGYSNYIDQTES